jgi:hypothetical protein
MSTKQNPPITPEIRELVEIAQHKIHQRFWKELVQLSVNPLVPFANMLHPAAEPLPPRQRITLLNILKRYAMELFDCEYACCAPTDGLSAWRSALAIGIEQSVMNNVSEIERGLRSLKYHASHDQMRLSVRDELRNHINELSKSVLLPPTPVDEIDDPPLKPATVWRPDGLVHVQPANIRERRRRRQPDVVVQRIKKKVRELKESGLPYSTICERLGTSERPPRAKWRDFPWPIAFKRHTSAVTKWLSEACSGANS